MLETIRQFAEEQLVVSGEADEARAAHARYFAGRETDILALWDSPQQREANDWFNAELANLRTAFRWAADHYDLDVAATIATYAGFLGYVVDKAEPIAWAEEVIEPAGVVDHPRLGFLYAIASQCWVAGRIEAAIDYTEACQRVLDSGRGYEVPFGINGLIGTVYLMLGQPDQYVAVSRAQLDHGHDTHILAQASLSNALIAAGSQYEAITAATGLVEAAEATRNPFVLSFALLVSGYVLRATKPAEALNALRRGLEVARDNGNRAIETHIAASTALLEVRCGDFWLPSIT